ncbi:MAG TPA: class E sortase [Solirubrobacteraceae bacterium]|nr:class E sortase [Solirubrobacteraceae bacterium]
MMAGPEVPGGASPDEPEAAARLTAPSDEPQAASRLEGPSPEQPEAASRARPPRRRRALRALSTLLIVAGALVLADGAATLVWQEPVTAVYARVQQERLEDELAALEQTEPAPAERRALVRLPDPRRRLGFAARALARRSEAGDPVGRLRVPAIGLRTVVVQGTGAGELRSGPGHYPGTPLPGQRGTVAIAGHRTTYGAPFRHVDDLARGDRIELDMPYGRFTYRVERTRVVPATAIDVVDRVAYDRLVLTACHPLYSAAERIVVFARLAAFR